MVWFSSAIWSNFVPPLTLGEADVKGTVSGNTVEFSFSAEVQGFALDVTYTGTLDDDGMLSGEASFGEAGDGTFTAKKS